MRLFFFPYAGGGASIFRLWAESLPSDVDVHLAQLPGRENKLMETPFTRLEPMVEAVAEAIVPLLDRPFAFFGHSMGALIGFELARLLRRRLGREPEHLFVSGRRAPHLASQESPTYNLNDADFIAKLRQLNGTPKEVFEHPELLPLILPLLRADFTVCETYAYKDEAPLNCPITVVSGLDDRHVGTDTLEEWRLQTKGRCDVHLFPGDHFFLHEARPHILRLMTRSLQQLAASSF
jgi:medium-chain acyl-[acyl-carrier-protein] hydrolase